MHRKTNWKLTFILAGTLLKVVLFSVCPAVAQESEAPRAAAGEQPALQGYEHRFRAMGTIIVVSVYAKDVEKLTKTLQRVERQVLEIESVLTDYDPDSEACQLSGKAVLEPTTASPVLWEVMHASDVWWKKTEGAFDSSLGALTKLWRKYRRTRTVPEKGLVEEALDGSGWKHVVLDGANQSVSLKRTVRFDFGGIGKGYVADQIYETLVADGFPQCLVNISGNIRCGSAPPNRAGWRIEVSGLAQNRETPSQQGNRPKRPAALRRIEVADTALATSGDLWQFIMIDGERRSHILSPLTGYGVPGPISATVIAPTAMEADACATAACILSSEKALQIAEAAGFELLLARWGETADKEENVGNAELQVLQTSAFPKPIPQERETAPKKD